MKIPSMMPGQWIPELPVVGWGALGPLGGVGARGWCPIVGPNRVAGGLACDSPASDSSTAIDDRANKPTDDLLKNRVIIVFLPS